MLLLFGLSMLSLGTALLRYPVTKKQSGPISVDNVDNNQYLVNINLLAPNQTFAMSLDSGSMAIFLNANALADCKAVEGTRPRDGNTEKFCEDDLSIGGLTARNQTFLLAQIEFTATNGILGLGPNKTNEQGHTSLVQNLYEQGQIENSVFSLYLSDDEFGSINATTPSSTLIIGGYDLETFSIDTEFKYMKVVDTHGWGIPLEGIAVNGDNVPQSTQLAYVDSGTSGIVGPGVDADTIMHKIADGRDCQFIFGIVLCDCNQDFPTITFTIDSQSFDITSTEYFWNDGNKCHLLINGSNLLDYWVLGDSVMRRFYTVFDVDNQQVGFAYAKKSEPKI